MSNCLIIRKPTVMSPELVFTGQYIENQTGGSCTTTSDIKWGYIVTSCCTSNGYFTLSSTTGTITVINNTGQQYIKLRVYSIANISAGSKITFTRAKDGSGSDIAIIKCY